MTQPEIAVLRDMNRKTDDMTFPWWLVVYEIAVYLSMDAYMPALPKIAYAFGVDSHTAQLTAIVWMVGGLLVQLVFGPLSDRYGRRPILLFGGGLYVVSTIVCAFSSDIHTMLIARFFQGMAMPSMFIAGYAAINELFESEKAVKILARMNSITILAPAFGPLLGSAFILFFDWRWIFGILSIWGFIAVVMLFFKMPETTHIDKRSTHLNFADIFFQYSSLATNIKFILFSLITFLPIIGLISWMLAGPFIIVEEFHYSTLVFGIIQTFIFSSFILGTKIVDKYANKNRNNLLVNIGLCVSLLGAILATITALYFTNSLFIVVSFIMFVTFGSGLSMPILSRLALETSDAPMGIRVTLFSIARISSGVVGSICVTIFYNGTLLSVATIMLFFTVIAAAIKMLYTKL